MWVSNPRLWHLRNVTPASATPRLTLNPASLSFSNPASPCTLSLFPCTLSLLPVHSLTLYGLLSSSLSLSLSSLSFSFSLYHFLFNAFTRWLLRVSEIGDFTVFSEDLGEHPRLILGFPSSGRLVLHVVFISVFHIFV